MIPPRPAATVVLLRDGKQGLEVFLLERSPRSNVLGGAHVFPGGKLDAADADRDWLARAAAPLDALPRALGEPELDSEVAAGLFVAAHRETFEEAGVLLSRGARDTDRRDALARVRAGESFHATLDRLGLTLDWQALVPWARWITPVNPHLFSTRFDARFFVAALPAGQSALHDNHEAVASFWSTPRAALESYWSGTLNFVPAQIMSLAALARMASVEDAVFAARTRSPPLMAIESITHAGLPAVAFPGDPRHSVAEAAWPGPTFLVLRNRRFEPVDGLTALLP